MIARIRKHTTLQMAGKKMRSFSSSSSSSNNNSYYYNNKIIDVLGGGWSQEMDTTMYEIVGSRSKKVLKRMQKAALSGTFNIAWTFKVVT